MLKKPFSTSVSFLHSWGPSQLCLLKRHVSSLPQHRVALAAAAAATLVTGATWGLGPSVRRPAAAPPNGRPTALLASREVAPVQPGYLVYRGGAPGTDMPPPQVSSRGGERPTATPATPTPAPTSTPTPQAKKISTYRVVAGDTVAGLAERFSISAETIVWANGLTGGSAALQPGQELTILPVSGVLHKVQPGDTLNVIAQAYGVQAGAVVETNALANPDQLAIDQALAIPGGRPLPPPTPRPTAAARTLVATAGPAAAAAPVSPEAAGKGAEIAAIAARYVGYPYVYAGSSPATGFDCSGLTQWVYGQAGISLPRTSGEQPAAGPAVLRSALLPGDLVFFAGTYGAGISHVGIYVGGGRMIHASTPATGVRYDSIDDAYWVAHYYGANRPWQ